MTKHDLAPKEIRGQQLGGLEAAIIGAIAGNPRRFREVRDIVRPEMFATLAGKTIAPILWDYLTTTGVDGLSIRVLVAKLPEQAVPDLREAMAMAIHQIHGESAGNPGLVDAAELLAANWQDSEYRAAFEGLAMTGFDGWQEADQVLSDVKARIIGRAITTPADALDALMQEIFDGLAGLKKYTGISSGIPALDEITGGWQPGQQIVIGGRPGMGKTRFAFAMCLEAAKAGIPAVFYTKEMKRRSMYRLAFAWLTGISVMQMKNLDLNVDESDRLAAARDLLKTWPLYIVDDVVTIEDLSYSLLDYKDRHGVGIFAVDYIQQLRRKDAKKSDNRNNELSDISSRLKELALKTDAPALVLSQLSRQVDGRPNKRPNMGDLRDSGAIEADADIVLFPFRPKEYDPDTDEGDEIGIEKHRDGDCGVAPVVWKNPGFYYPAEPTPTPLPFDPSLGGKMKPAELITKRATIGDDEKVPF